VIAHSSIFVTGKFNCLCFSLFLSLGYLFVCVFGALELGEEKEDRVVCVFEGGRET
jgi:hypothetical protein